MPACVTRVRSARAGRLSATMRGSRRPRTTGRAVGMALGDASSRAAPPAASSSPRDASSSPPADRRAPIVASSSASPPARPATATTATEFGTSAALTSRATLARADASASASMRARADARASADARLARVRASHETRLRALDAAHRADVERWKRDELAKARDDARREVRRASDAARADRDDALARAARAETLAASSLARRRDAETRAATLAESNARLVLAHRRLVRGAAARFLRANLLARRARAFLRWHRTALRRRAAHAADTAARTAAASAREFADRRAADAARAFDAERALRARLHAALVLARLAARRAFLDGFARDAVVSWRAWTAARRARRDAAAKRRDALRSAARRHVADVYARDARRKTRAGLLRAWRATARVEREARHARVAREAREAARAAAEASARDARADDRRRRALLRAANVAWRVVVDAGKTRDAEMVARLARRRRNARLRGACERWRGVVASRRRALAEATRAREARIAARATATWRRDATVAAARRRRAGRLARDAILRGFLAGESRADALARGARITRAARRAFGGDGESTGWKSGGAFRNRANAKPTRASLAETIDRAVRRLPASTCLRAWRGVARAAATETARRVASLDATRIFVPKRRAMDAWRAAVAARRRREADDASTRRRDAARRVIVGWWLVTAASACEVPKPLNDRDGDGDESARARRAAAWETDRGRPARHWLARALEAVAKVASSRRLGRALGIELGPASAFASGAIVAGERLNRDADARACELRARMSELADGSSRTSPRTGAGRNATLFLTRARDEEEEGFRALVGVLERVAEADISGSRAEAEAAAAAAETKLRFETPPPTRVRGEKTAAEGKLPPVRNDAAAKTRASAEGRIRTARRFAA